MNKTLDRSTIVSRAREQLGVPYHVDQYVPGLALDCVGLIRYAYDYQENLDSRLYSVVLTGDSLVQNFIRLGFDFTTNPEPGDVIIWTYGGNPHHTGIYTGYTSQDSLGVDGNQRLPSCIHSSAAYGKVHEHLIAFEWIDRLYCYLTHPRLTLS